MGQVLSKTILMNTNLIQPLPVCLDGYQDESGLSYVFRSCLANGLSLVDARSWLGLTTWNSISRRDIQTMSWALGVDYAWLLQRMIVSHGTGLDRVFGFYGQCFGGGMLNFIRSARLCPECLKQEKYGRATWLLLGICGCHQHQCLLLERCPYCQRLISWNRPAIDVCRCGGFLTAKENRGTCLSKQAIAWNHWIEVSLAYPGEHISPMDFALPVIFRSLSVDGAIRLVHAMGLLLNPDHLLRDTTMKIRSCSEMSGIVERALERLAILNINDRRSCQRLGELIHLPVLEKMKFRGMTFEDRNCAAVLMENLHFKEKRTGRLPKGQLSLF